MTEDEDITVLGSGTGGISALQGCIKDKDLSIGYLKLEENTFAIIAFISQDVSLLRSGAALSTLMDCKLMLVVSTPFP